MRKATFLILGAIGLCTSAPDSGRICTVSTTILSEHEDPGWVKPCESYTSNSAILFLEGSYSPLVQLVYQKGRQEFSTRFNAAKSAISWPNWPHFINQRPTLPASACPMVLSLEVDSGSACWQFLQV